MRKSSIVILACVALFLASVIGLLVMRGRSLSPDRTEAPPSKADFRIKEVHLQETGSGDVHWQLEADQAEVFEREGKTLLRGVTITIREPERTWRATADEGDLLQPAKDVTIRKNVVLVSSDGLRLETDILRWQAKDRKVWTETPVTVYQNGVIVKGQGLEHLLDEERTRIRGRVRATFTRATQLPGRGQAR